MSFTQNIMMRESKTEHQKVSQNIDNVLAEKCRIALEKSWGIDIPTPKSWNNKANRKKNTR
jgi:hypothetical protein